MGIRYRKSIRLGGGVRLNLSKSGMGMSAGIPGFRVGTNSSGRITRYMGIPGTGLYSRSSVGSSPRGSNTRARPASSGRRPQSIPASEATNLLPKPGWLSGAGEKRYYEGVQAYLKSDYASALAAFAACLVAEPKAASAHLFAALCVGKLDGPDVEQIQHLEAVVGGSDPIPDRLQTKYLPPGFVELTLTVKITDMIWGQAPVGSVGATLMLAELYQAGGRLEEALGLIQQLHEAEPADTTIRLSLADLYFADQDFEGVLDAASSAINDSDTGVALLHLRAAALVQLGHMDGALDAFRQALAKTSNRDPDLLKVVRYDRALAYEAAGQPRKARIDLEKIMATDPSYLDVRERLQSLQ